MTLTTQPTIRNYTAGTWSIDPARSEIGFSVRHTVVGRVGGSSRRSAASLSPVSHHSTPA